MINIVITITKTNKIIIKIIKMKMIMMIIIRNTKMKKKEI